jgi:outer membrane protein OmpA-like peptidoglycan-associated protein
MSDEKNAMKESPSAVDNSAEGAHPEIVATKPSIPTTVVLGFLIIAVLLVVLIVTQRVRPGSNSQSNNELAELEAEARALRNQLNQELLAQGLRPIEEQSESIDEIAGRLKKDTDTIVSLSGSFQSLLAEKDAALLAANSGLLRSEEQRQNLAMETQRLRTELQQALAAGSQAELLRTELAATQSQRDTLAAELKTLRDQPPIAPAAITPEQERQLEEALRAKDFFEARVKQLEAELTKARLFANSENELLPAAVNLVRKLRTLEGKPQSELANTYSAIGTEIGADVRQTLKFKTDSTELSPEDQEAIRTMVENVPDGDLVLAIGYASETGNVEHNQTLSSQRATAAAELYASIKRPEQQVQAVYLGQTDRFSAKTPEQNQIVEIWHIRKQP